MLSARLTYDLGEVDLWRRALLLIGELGRGRGGCVRAACGFALGRGGQG